MTSSSLAEADASIRAFLKALELRDHAEAARFVTPRTQYVFPGGASRSSLDEVIAGSAQRYRHVGKTIERVDALPGEDGIIIVYCFGDLHGVWKDGETFSGIRFIDRFELRDGKILRQDVWNDAGFAMMARGR